MDKGRKFISKDHITTDSNGLPENNFVNDETPILT